MAEPEKIEDPLIAALPPATDYITYLTLLEYQLSPRNLPTLNTLLSEDDGTLATEIGWDLLKLVLPMLQVEHDVATKCLGIIARRGNPREVIVRVAEELEKLGQHDDDESSTIQDNSEVMETFSGEADRIHLGDMKLEGMPPHPHESRTAPISSPAPNKAEDTTHIHDDGARRGSDDDLIWEALVSMLSSLHPRVKTKHPSRFLATSLPAALSAYRRIPVTFESTSAFIAFLSKLGGKQRPALPPRTSTTGDVTSATSAGLDTELQVSAPLPDPESRDEAHYESLTIADNEKAIMQRLVEAVLLEVVDEYTQALQTSSTPTMCWTVRLREQQEPQRVVPGRQLVSQLWQQTPELMEKERMFHQVLKLANDLRLDAWTESRRMTSPIADEAEVEEAESDYPTKPSHVPFPATGLALLCAAQGFYESHSDPDSLSSLRAASIKDIFELLHTIVTSSEPLSLSVIDGLLSLLYRATTRPRSNESHSNQVSEGLSVELPDLEALTHIFTSSPEISLRDSGHHIATLLLRNDTSYRVRKSYYKSLLGSPNAVSTNPFLETHASTLKSFAISWLKDDLLYELSSSTAEKRDDDGTVPGTLAMLQDPEISALVFAAPPPLPGPWISSHPGAVPSVSNTPRIDLETILSQIPCFVAALNLITVLAGASQRPQMSKDTTTGENDQVEGSSSTDLAQRHPSQPSTAAAAKREQGIELEPDLANAARQFTETLESWSAILGHMAQQTTSYTSSVGGDRTEEEGGGASIINVSDVFALEDAVARARMAVL